MSAWGPEHRRIPGLIAGVVRIGRRLRDPERGPTKGFEVMSKAPGDPASTGLVKNDIVETE